jgi:protein TonB
VQPEVSEEAAAAAARERATVRFEIAADGTFAVALVDSTGSRSVDQAVLRAARRWKWQPALDNGAPVASTVVRGFRLRR